MRVKCVDNKGKCNGYELSLTINKEYEVLELEHDRVLIMNDSNVELWYYLERFEIIKEDKTEEVKAIRNFEDLVGLENGHGATIKSCYIAGEYMVIEKESGANITRFNRPTAGYIPAIKGVFKMLRCLGFNVEYKPLRTEEEVVAEMRTKTIPFTFNGYNYYIKHVANYNKYYISYDCHDNIIGTIYLDKETATKYCNELNEIMEAKCNG